MTENYAAIAPTHLKEISENAIGKTTKFLSSQAKSYALDACRLIIFSKLKLLHTGSLTIKESGRSSQEFGNRETKPVCEIRVCKEAFWLRLLFNGAMLLILNRDDTSDYSTISSIAVSLASGLYRASNSLSVSLSNVTVHYDLSNQVFAAFLSPDMTYSCPIWSSCDSAPSDSALLELGQLRKLRKIISEARIKASDHVLEIGTGWGSFAMEAVRRTGCTVTSVTLSIEQKEEAEERIKAAGLANKITVLLKDYRKIETVEGGYDKIVSIEMMEHVGRENLETYFGCISKLLSPRFGIAVFQTSTMPETRYEAYCRGTDFIRKHIFPGANVPSVTQIMTSMHRGSAGKLIVDKLENIGGHYAKTLKVWHDNFLRNFSARIRPEVLRMNPRMSEMEIEIFRRKWEYYFCYCEAGFATKTLGAVVFTVGREGNTDMISDIINGRGRKEGNVD
ncbi:hypothetical protein B7494_g4794 [Chlorociboria aeruginascens]|nr:hypothetical protein B7494_g4794 [Chlorociboria aeruginascens]